MTEYTSLFRIPAFRRLHRVLTARWSAVVLWLLLALFVATRVLFFDRFSVGGGELYAYIPARLSWSELFSFAVDDIVHPPLFYVLLKLWIALGGESLTWVKLFAVLNGVAIIVPFLLICRTFRLTPAVRNLALLFLVSNGYLTHYAQELRMYGLFATVALLSLWLFLRYWASPTILNRFLIALFFANLAMIYTHYYGWLLVGLEFVLLVVWQRKKLPLFGASVMVLVLTMLPWVHVVYQEAERIGGLGRNLDWIPRPGLTRLASLYSDFLGTSGIRPLDGLALVLFVAPVLVMAWTSIRPGWNAMRASRDGHLDPAVLFWILLSIAYLPSLFLFAVSQRTSVAFWIDRYFVFAAVPHMLLVAMAIQRLRPVLVMRLAVAFVVIWSLGTGVRDIVTNRMAWQGSQLGSRIRWEALARQLSRSETEQRSSISVYTLPVYSEGLLTGDWVISTSMPFYLDALPDRRFQFVYARDTSNLLRQVHDRHFWVAFFELGQSSSVSPVMALTRNGYRVGEPIVDDHGYNRLLLVPVWQD